MYTSTEERLSEATLEKEEVLKNLSRGVMFQPSQDETEGAITRVPPLSGMGTLKVVK